MAIYNAGYLSPIRKKLGNAVGRKWRNLNVLSVYQPNVRNPRTQVQQTIRAKFKVLSRLSMMAQYPIVLGLSKITEGTKIPPRSMFIKLNFPIVQGDSPDALSVDWEDLKLSYGGLDAVTAGMPSFADPLSVKVTLTPSSEITPTTNPNDQVFMVVYSPEAFRFVVSEPVLRSAAAVSVGVPAFMNGHRVHVYMFAIGRGEEDMDKVSMTQYIGSGTIS